MPNPALVEYREDLMKRFDIWRRSASCRGRSDDFFPQEPDRAITTELRRICSGCPVRFECLRHCIIFREEGYGGIWGGFTMGHLKNLAKKYWTLFDDDESDWNDYNGELIDFSVNKFIADPKLARKKARGISIFPEKD